MKSKTLETTGMRVSVHVVPVSLSILTLWTYHHPDSFKHLTEHVLTEIEIHHSPFLHYPLVPSFIKINIRNTGNQNPPEGGFWLPVFPILIFVSR